jgi:glycosyltransferase involved in cell wall biosynthesis
VEDSQEFTGSVCRLRIVLINHYAGSPKHGMEYRAYYMARQWLRMGHDVTIVASSESHLRSVDVAVSASITEESIDGVRYVWLRTPKYHGNGARRLLNMTAFVTQILRYAKEILTRRGADVVIASSTYPLDIVAGRRLARLSGATLIFEVHDLWPLSLVQLANMKRSHPFIALMQWAENLAYRSADIVVSILPDTIEHMVAHGMRRNKFLHIPNGVDREAWFESQRSVPDKHASEFQRLRERGRFIIGYAGSHGMANSLETVLDAAELLRDIPVTFVLVGQGPHKDGLAKAAEARGLSNVLFLPAVERSAVPQLLANFDGAYLGWHRQPLYQFGISPNKLIDYMMAGLPVIHGVEASNDLVAEARCGFSIPPEDAATIQQAVLQLLALPQSERIAMGNRGREYILANHTYEVLAKRFLDAVNPERQCLARRDG